MNSYVLYGNDYFINKEVKELLQTKAIPYTVGYFNTMQDSYLEGNVLYVFSDNENDITGLINSLIEPKIIIIKNKHIAKFLMEDFKDVFVFIHKDFSLNETITVQESLDSFFDLAIDSGDIKASPATLELLSLTFFALKEQFFPLLSNVEFLSKTHLRVDVQEHPWAFNQDLVKSWLVLWGPQVRKLMWEQQWLLDKDNTETRSHITACIRFFLEERIKEAATNESPLKNPVDYTHALIGLVHNYTLDYGVFPLRVLHTLNTIGVLHGD